MNAADILKYGHLTLMHELELTTDWDTPGAAGTWSVKDIFAHLTAYEHIIAEVLQGFVGASGDTPYMQQMFGMDDEAFNAATVEAMRPLSRDAVMQDYTTTHDRVMQLIVQIPVEMRQQNGTLPWYGADYALDDFIVYTQYGHKREHSAQIALFRDR